MMSEHTPHEAIARDPKSLPVMLPGKLIGRETLLAEIYAKLKENNPVLIYGEAGVGKTALATMLASAYAQQAGGVLWLNVDHPRLEELLVRVGRAYDVGEIANSDTPLGVVGAVENTIRTNKPFIVLDGAIDGGVLSRFISRCVDHLPLLIVTSQSHVGLWETLEVAPLDDDSAAALYKREGRVAVNEHDDDVFEIIDLIGTHPIAVIVAARAMAASKQAPDAFLKLLSQISATTGTGSAVAFTASFRALNGALQGLVLMMGALFPNGAGAEMLSLVSGAPLESVEQAMTILAQLYLVERTTRYGEHHYQMHALVYDFARGYLVNAGKLEALQTKVRDAALTYARKHTGNPDKLAMEMDSFLAVALWSLKQGDKPHAADIANALSAAGDFIEARGYAYDVMRMRDVATSTGAFPAYTPESGPVIPMLDDDDGDDSEYAIDEDALEPVDGEDEEQGFSPEDMLFPDATSHESRFTAAFGDDEDAEEDDSFDEDEDGNDEVFAPEDVRYPQVTDTDLDTQDDTQLRNTLARVRQAGDTDKQIDVLQAMGKRQVEAKRETEAIATYNELLDAYEKAENDQGILETLDMLSALMVKTQNSQAAIMHAMRGVRLADDLDDEVTKLQLQLALGDARQQLGESLQAIDAYSAALLIARRTGDNQNEAIALYKLGYAQLDDGDTEAAIDNFEQALALFKAQGKRDYEGRVMGGLGSAYSDLARWSEAMSFHTSALYVAREVGDHEEEALQLTSLAYAAVQANQLGEALLRYRQALHLAFQSQNREDIVSLLVDLTRLLLRSQMYASIAEMLLDTAEDYEPTDKDVLQLRVKLLSVMDEAESRGIVQKAVNGDAILYAANAYKLLEE